MAISKIPNQHYRIFPFAIRTPAKIADSVCVLGGITILISADFVYYIPVFQEGGWCHGYSPWYIQRAPRCKSLHKSTIRTENAYETFTRTLYSMPCVVTCCCQFGVHHEKKVANGLNIIRRISIRSVSYTHLRAHETDS